LNRTSIQTVEIPGVAIQQCAKKQLNCPWNSPTDWRTLI
jgi:hypothetical protein